MKLCEIYKPRVVGKGYSSLSLNSRSVKQINKILNNLNISDSVDDFHITLMYDTSNPDINIELDNEKVYNASIIGVKELGKPDSKWFSIALTLYAPDIEKRHRDYIDAGFKHSYPEFIPHLSLKYQPSKEDINIIKDNLDLFKKIKLKFSNEHLDVVEE